MKLDNKIAPKMRIKILPKEKTSRIEYLDKLKEIENKNKNSTGNVSCETKTTCKMPF